MRARGILEQQASERAFPVNDERTTYLQDGRTKIVAAGSEAGAEVVFVVGPPGCGKTTMVDTLKASLECQGWHVLCFDDYPLLFSMAEREQRLGQSLTRAAQFCPLLNENGELKGFTVKDLSVLEEVLCEIGRGICQYLFQPHTIILVEFARDEYPFTNVWRHFCHEVRMTARYLFCEAGLDICIERVEQREQQCIDAQVMRSYYSKDGLPSLIKHCNLDRIEVINTDRTMQETTMQIELFKEKLGARPIFKTEQSGLGTTRRNYSASSAVIARREREGASEAFARL